MIITVSDSTTTALQIITNAGIKPSVQRIAIMDYMLTHHTHPTVDEIYRALNKDFPTISRTTVYNTLRTLVEKGCVTGIDIDNTNARFDGVTKPHAHFMCKCCGRIIDIDLPQYPQVPGGFDVQDTQVYFKGVCNSCNRS